MASNYQIPYDTDTRNHLTHDRGYQIVWYPNKEWEDELQLVKYTRGRSSVTFVFRSIINGDEFHAFVSNSFEIFKDSVGGVISGRFTFVKKGSDYGVKYLGPLTN
jgi:hypothetical protein